MDEVTIISLVLMAGMALSTVFSVYLEKHNKTLQWIKWIAFGIYIAVNLYMTVLWRQIGDGPKYELELFWSYKKAILEQNSEYLKEILLNILLYIPFGFLLPDIWNRMRLLKAFAIGIVSSFVTEFIQLVFCIGLFEFDDVISNGIGFLCGYGCYKTLSKFYRKEDRM